MLRQLYIRNYALIDELDMEFRSGFSVMTGETGAGKSIILGAIGLLLGQRADSKTVKMGTEKCVIEAHFDLSRYGMQPFFEENDIEFDANDTIIRRELTSAGKSRAFINDVIAQDTKELGDYQQAFVRYHDLKKEEERVRQEIEQGRQAQDFLQFQYEELTNAKLVDGEQEELEQRSETMTHSEDIKTALYEAENALQGDERSIVGSLKKATSALQGIERVYPDVAELAERLNSCYIELKDVASEVSGALEDVDFDPAELDSVNARLDKIYDLEKKYKVESVDELIALQQDLGRKLSNIENSDEALAELERQAAAAMKEAQAKADVLTKMRKQAAKTIEQQMQSRLVPLGMPHVRFQIVIESSPLSHDGQDNVSFLFSANTSTPLQPVSQVASGGEIARVMLSLKAMISGTVKLPTIIFDEIDTGVSGKIAEQMAQMMAEMGRNERQVISITHLPQIAALGTTHYKVYKEETPQGTTSHMQMLTDDERVGEIAQMLSGSDVTEAAIQNAKELLRR